MGRHDFRAQRVLTNANLALQNKLISSPPVWHDVIQNIPPPPRLARPVKKHITHGKYKPSRIWYPEDRLRQEFFSDHPWELARPKVVLEDSGNDHEAYDWSKLEQDGKRMDGESVVQYQLWLKENGYNSDPTGASQPVSHYRAYDIARKEFYAHRHFEDVERRIAREEALHTGAYFNLGPNALAEPLEDAQFDRWKQWAAARASAQKNARLTGYSGTDADEGDEGGSGDVSASEAAAVEEQEGVAREEAELASAAARASLLPQTSRGIVADAIGDLVQGRR